MKLRLRRQETGRGEWSVLDPLRGYRVCRYNHEHHAGTHIHYPEDSQSHGTVALDTPAEAENVMRRYGAIHEVFDLAKFQEVIQEWKSESADA